MLHKITIGIDAPTEKEALQIAKALVQIKNSLQDKDLMDLARILKENPGIVEMAKKMLG
jgi:hypothetical protein